jgi:hypothetical protein
VEQVASFGNIGGSALKKSVLFFVLSALASPLAASPAVSASGLSSARNLIGCWGRIVERQWKLDGFLDELTTCFDPNGLYYEGSVGGSSLYGLEGTMDGGRYVVEGTE